MAARAPAAISASGPCAELSQFGESDTSRELRHDSGSLWLAPCWRSNYWIDSKLQALCKRQASAAMPRGSVSKQRPDPDLACTLHFCGTRRNAATPLARLITRRSQVQFCPRYCGRRSKGRLSLFLFAAARLTAPARIHQIG